MRSSDAVGEFLKCVTFSCMLAGTSGRNALHEPPVLPRSKSLSSKEWEEQAYEIIRRQKLRESAALRARRMEKKSSQVSSKKYLGPSHPEYKLLDSNCGVTKSAEVVMSRVLFSSD